ncbi:MAG TPA: response regulator transcription factor [Candidatus Polarisedimenticolia bacterium]|nr:response regulator transcription factor [Candidatus Polarisedimenticolia bacterium]
MSVLRLLIADDHEIVRRGLCALLKSHAEWEVCAEAGDGREAVEKAQQLKPDIVILDIGMPNLNGLIAARQILRIRPDQKILILTITDEEQVVREVLEAGARGFVLKSDAARDLVAAVEALQAGTTFFTSRIGEMVLRAYLDKGRGGSERVPDLSSLTSRERGMVQLLAEGKSTKEVAFLLNLGVKTAERQRSNIMRKLGFHSTSELVLYAVRNHIIEIHIGPQ